MPSSTCTCLVMLVCWHTVPYSFPCKRPSPPDPHPLGKVHTLKLYTLPSRWDPRARAESGQPGEGRWPGAPLKKPQSPGRAQGSSDSQRTDWAELKSP